MPPAFVLSQDQTLRKIKLFYRKIRFKAFKILRLEINFVSCEFSRFTSHYSIFNQLTRIRASDRDIIYHRFFTLQIVFEKFFDFFSKPGIFQICDPQNFQCYISLAASSHSTRNRNIIYHRFLFLQIVFEKFFDFFQNRKFSNLQPAKNCRCLYQPRCFVAFDAQQET